MNSKLLCRFVLIVLITFSFSAIIVDANENILIKKTISDSSYNISALLYAKKREYSQQKLNANEYIKYLNELFAVASGADKKKILREIAKAKEELNDYSIGAFVRGRAIEFDKFDSVYPIIENGRTLVPVRAVAQSLDAKVEWVEDKALVVIIKDDIKIELVVDSKISRINGKETELDVPAIIKNGRTLVPVRYISESLKLVVNWDEASKTVIIEEAGSEELQIKEAKIDDTGYITYDYFVENDNEDTYADDYPSEDENDYEILENDLSED